MKQNNAAQDSIDVKSNDAHIFTVPADSSHSDWLLKAAREDEKDRPGHAKNNYTFEVIREWGDTKTVAVWE